jgi:hypothetical protein
MLIRHSVINIITGKTKLNTMITYASVLVRRREEYRVRRRKKSRIQSKKETEGKNTG